MYAIIATGGKQYKVSEGDVIKVEKLGVVAGETVTFDKVLLVNKVVKVYSGRVLTCKRGVVVTRTDSSQRADIFGQLVESYDLLCANAVAAENFTPRISTLNLLAFNVVVVGSDAEDDIISLDLLFALRCATDKWHSHYRSDKYINQSLHTCLTPLGILEPRKYPQEPLSKR